MPGMAQTPGACYAENLEPPRNPFLRGITRARWLGWEGREIRPSHPSGDSRVCHLMAVGHTIVARAMVWLSISKPSRAPLVVAPSPVLGSSRAVTVM